LDKGLVGTLLRYPYEVRTEQEFFDEIQDVKVTKDMLDLAKHIVNQKSGRFSYGTTVCFPSIADFHMCQRDVRLGCASCKGGAFQWVHAPPGNRSSRKQSEQSWR
jgi:hypothetical protein